MLVAISFLLLACVAKDTAGPPDGAAQLPGVKAVGAAQAAGTAAPKPAQTPAVIVVTPANRAINVAPDAVVTVRVSSGTLRSVTLVDDKGIAVRGQAGPGPIWGTDVLLRPSAGYTLTIDATGPDGMATSTRSTFRTLTPEVSASYSVMPSGGVVGVGMPVILQFDSAVSTKAQKAQVEKRVTVTSVPVQMGSWGWLDDRQLMWRPRVFWIPGTKVTVSAPLHGVTTGDGKWITQDNGTRFTVGPSMVSSVNMKSHTMTVRRNGAVIRKFPVSTGRPGPKTETRSGVKIIMERSSVVVMDSATIGIPPGSPGYYKKTTHWNLRVTWTGEFIHSAPWSVGAQGSTNVSHGCTNMSPSAAQWMFNNSRMGDVVSYTGSSRAFQPEEGIGVWVYDFAGWKARSALNGV
jgi:lipoprotein-anchoring transpeptidase ErfK/SrfK